MQNEARNDVRVPFVNHDDPTLLLVRGNIENADERKRYLKSLADAILAVYYKHKVVNLRCVGPASVSNAMKAYINASNEALKSEIQLATTGSFQTVMFDGNQEKTAILITVRRVKFIDD